MANILGIILFALGIGLTIALHESGHMLSARAFGMRVRRFSIGFGPKLLAFKRGNTEYSLALLPLGGFCDIAGMTAQDELLTEDEAPKAMCRQAAWKRVVVMAGGVIINVVLGFALLFGVAVTAGLPDLHADMRPRVGEVVCSADQIDAWVKIQPCTRHGMTASSTLFQRILFELKEDRPNYGELHCC